MTRDNYTILRFSKPKSTHRFLGSADSSTGTTASRMSIEYGTLTAAEAAALDNDPNIAHVPTQLPLTLIAPTQSDDSSDTPPPAGGATWGLEAVSATKTTLTGTGARVALLDTGIDQSHPVFAHMASTIVFRNFTTGDYKDCHDSNGHGTHCAGTICGLAANEHRIGVAPGVDSLIVAKVIGDAGVTTETLLRAMAWALNEGANIISMSLSLDFTGWVAHLHESLGVPLKQATSMALRDYRRTLLSFSKIATHLSDQGVLVIAASGNDSKRPEYNIDVSPPAAGDGILSVGAVGRTSDGLTVASFSNSGCTLVAPGVEVLSAKPGGGLALLSGTSMAVPHAAGVAALWIEALERDQLSINHEVLKGRLLGHASMKDLVAGFQRDDVGIGVVQAPA